MSVIHQQVVQVVENKVFKDLRNTRAKFSADFHEALDSEITAFKNCIDSLRKSEELLLDAKKSTKNGWRQVRSLLALIFLECGQVEFVLCGLVYSQVKFKAVDGDALLAWFRTTWDGVYPEALICKAAELCQEYEVAQCIENVMEFETTAAKKRRYVPCL